MTIHDQAEKLRKQVADNWTDEKNQRRCDLIDKEITGTIAYPETGELATLQNEMQAYRHAIAPLPIAEVKALHDKLKAQLAAASTEGPEDDQTYAALKVSVGRITRMAQETKFACHAPSQCPIAGVVNVASYLVDVCEFHDIEIPADSE